MIIVDVHEPKEIAEYLAQRSKSIVQHLSYGDYLIGHIAIERKTLADFLSSLVQQRLFSQLQTLKTNYPTCFLLIEAYDLTYLVNPQVVFGAILTIMLELNIKILFTQTKEQTAEFILLLAGQKSFSSEETFSPLSRRPKEKTLSQIQVELLSEIPLIGKRKATLLLHKFGTLQNIFEAETKELQVLPGFGERTAEKIKEVFSK